MASKELPELPVKRRSDGYWIVGVTSAGLADCGPYRTKNEALEERQGLLRAYKRHPGLLDPDYGQEWRPENLVATTSVTWPWVPREWKELPAEELAALGITKFLRKPGEKFRIQLPPLPQARRRRKETSLF